MCSTMGPGVSLDVTELTAQEERRRRKPHGVSNEEQEDKKKDLEAPAQGS